MQLIITTVFFFLTLTLFGQTNDAEAFFRGSYDKAFIRKHKIRQITVQAYINSNKSSLFLFDFDQQGFLKEETIFDSSGKKVNGYTFTYNEQGDQTERKNTAYDLNKTYTASFNRIYDGSHLVQETSSDLPFVTKHIYDNKGKKVQSNIFLEADTTTGEKQIFSYTYDSKGKLKSILESHTYRYSSTPVSIGTTEYIYNAAGNVTAIIREGNANCELRYDEGRLLKSKTIIMPEDLGGLKIVDKYSYIFRK